jgi:hypothetical protein
VRRIGRYIVNGLTVLSLGLCVATVVLWVRSYRRADSLCSYTGSFEIISFGGRVGADWEPKRMGINDLHWGQVEGFAFDVAFPFAEHHGFAGFAWFVLDPRVGLTFPHWALTLILGALPVSFALAVARRARHSMNRCARCGYDLRATPNRCPECGTVPTKVKA